MLIILILLTNNIFQLDYFNELINIEFYDNGKEYRVMINSDSLRNTNYNEKYNENIKLVDYLITHKSNIKIRTYSNNVNKDSIATIIRNEMINNNDLKKYIELLFYKIDLQKVTITIDEVMDIASYYFFVMRVNKDSSLYATICTGNNGLPVFKQQTDLILSGFIFSILFENIRDTKYNIFNRFTKLIHKYNTMYLELDNAKRVEKIQTEIFELMRNDKKVKEMFIDKINDLKYSPYFLEY